MRLLPSRLRHVQRWYLVPHSPQYSLSDSAYLLLYLLRPVGAFFFDGLLPALRRANFCLSGVEGLAAYYPLVVILYQIHRELASVFLDLLVDAIVYIGFLEQHIAAIFLISKYAVYCIFSPIVTPQKY